MIGLGLGASLALGGGKGVPAIAPITMDMVVNFDGITGALTAAKMNTGTHGGFGDSTWTTPEGDPTHTSVEDHDVLLPIPFSLDGTEYDGSSGLGATFDFATEPVGADVFHYGLATTVSDCQLIFLVKYATVLDGVSPVSYNCDFWLIASGNYVVPQRQHTFSNVKILTCHSDGDLGASITDNGAWLLVSVFHDSSNNRGRMIVQEVVQDGLDWVLGDVLGTSTSIPDSPFGDVGYIRFQDYLRPASGTGNIKVKIAGLRSSVLSWPPYNLGTIAAPTSVSVSQTSTNEATLIWTSVFDVFRIDRKVGSGSYVTVQNEYENNGTGAYPDTTVSEGNTYTYRLTAIVGGQESGSVESNSVTITAFTPASGCVLWLKADSLALANNDPVTTWNDSSGNGNNVTQATAGAKPTYKTNILNGLPVVRGDGGDHLAHTGVVTASEQHTIMCVLKKSSVDSTVPVYNGNAGSNGYGLFQNASGNRTVLFGGAIGKEDGAPSATDFEIWETTWNGTISEFWVNGVDQVLTDPSIPPVTPSGNTFVMGLSGTNQWSGDIAEVLIWNNVVSSTDRQFARNYLTDKYAL